jgi:hypothetical protein
MAQYKVLKRGKRVVRVFDAQTEEVVLNYATTADLKNELGFTPNDIKNIHEVLADATRTIKGFRLTNIGILRDE